MIKTKQDLKEYLPVNRIALGEDKKYWDLRLRFQRALRYSEYYDELLSVITNFTVPNNVCGKGLALAHVGPIIINGNAKIGEYCRIHVGVNIGTKEGTADQAPHDR